MKCNKKQYDENCYKCDEFKNENCPNKMKEGYIIILPLMIALMIAVVLIDFIFNN